MKKQLGILVLLMCLACTKKGPKVPEAAELIFPERNSECTTGVSLNDATSQVTFRWQAAKNTETYVLSLVNLETNVPQTITSDEPTTSLALQKGAPFSWSITSENTETSETATSDIWYFYNSGYTQAYAPFPASLLAPKSGATVVTSGSNMVNLVWSGADLDDDITTYEVFVDTVNPPQQLVASVANTVTEFGFTAAASTLYYWRVQTIDASGNSTASGVYDFKTL